MAKRVVSGTLFVSINEYIDLRNLSNKDEQKAISALTFTTSDITKLGGYSKAGKATVTVELDDDKALIENKADSIRAEITKVKADAENAITQLKDKLNRLLAITA